MREIFIPIFLIYSVLILSHAAFAQGEPWSFDDHPHPRLSDMTATEKAYLDKQQEENFGSANICEIIVRAEYDLYLQRYPDFKDTGDEAGNFTRWKNHVSADNDERDTICLFVTPLQHLAKLQAERQIRRDFYYCGRYSRTAWTSPEGTARTLVEEALRYASHGNWEAIILFLQAQDENGLIHLNADVEYYLRMRWRRTQVSGQH